MDWCLSMKVTVIHSGQVENLTFCRKLDLFFSTRFLKMSDVSPLSVSDADVILVEFADAQDCDLHKLREHREFLDFFPVVAVVDYKSRRECFQADALRMMNVFDRSDRLSKVLSLIKRLGAPDLLAALPEDTPDEMKLIYKQANAHLEAFHLAAVTDEAIPIESGREVASNLLTILQTNGIHAWIKMVKFHHNPTYAHSLEVAGFAGWLACQLDWSEDDCLQVIVGGLLHDIGKSRIPQDLLDEPTDPDGVELNLVQKHAQLGYEILKDRFELDNETKEIVYFHHEMLDGSGYPIGLSGEAINPKVRVITIADLFTTLTEERACKPALSHREAIASMNKMYRKIDQAFYAAFRYGMLSHSDDVRQAEKIAS